MTQQVAVVIPCFRVKDDILQVIAGIGPEVARIYVVDDACPDGSGELVRAQCRDARVSVLQHVRNKGVGGAVMTGYAAAIADGATVLVKVDGDGQMDPALIDRFVRPILRGQADYTNMPAIRLVGNSVLSFMAKLSTGYWHLFDPTNGFTAIHARVARHLHGQEISERYFFETDMLFRLNILRAVVVDIPMDARYGDEKSNLRVSQVMGEFLFKHVRNFGKRIFYGYFLRDTTVASLELLLGSALLTFGVVFGGLHWAQAMASGKATPLGTIMLAALPSLVGLQMLLAFVAFDVANVPRRPIHDDLPD